MNIESMENEPVDEPPETILVVDDDDILRTRMAKAFEKRGFRTLMAGYSDEVKELVPGESPPLPKSWCAA